MPYIEFISRLCLFVSNLQVRKDDNTSKVCRLCFDRINIFFRFRELSAARNINYLLRKIRSSMERPPDVAAALAIDRPNSVHGIFSGGVKSSCNSDSRGKNTSCGQTAPIICITVTDSDSEDEGVNDDLHNGAGQIETSGARHWQSANRIEHRLETFPVKCQIRICPNYFENEDAMMFHINTYHRKGITRSLECFLCKKSLAAKRSLEEHMNAFHSHAKKIKCTFSDCSRIFYHYSALLHHIKFAHDRESMSPDESDQSANSDAMDKRNDGWNPIVCRFQKCNTIFETVGAKMYHMSSYHRWGIKRTYECYICKSPITNRRWFERHMIARHRRQKSFKCPFPDCQQFFDHKLSVRKHIYCRHVRKAVSFGKTDQLTKYRYVVNRKTNNNFKFKCDYRKCTNVFEGIDAMLYHSSTYHRRESKKTFECFLCKVTPLELQSLKQHMSAMHCSRISYECSFPDCLRTFYCSSMIRKHIKVIHAN